MGVEQMITEAILIDRYSGTLRKIAGEQDAYARRTKALDVTGNVLIGMGSAALAFGKKSVEAAGKVDEFRRAVEKVRGAKEAAFATKFVNDFDKHSSFAYFDLIDAAKRLEIQNGNLGKSFEDIADVAAISGRSLMDVVSVYDAVKGGGRVGLGLSARGGFAQFGIQPRDIFKAEGIPYTPKNLQNAMTPDQVIDGLHKVLLEKHKSGYDRVAATTTLRGAQSMITGAVERLEASVGEGSLPKTVGLLNTIAGEINVISEEVKSIPGFGDNLFLGAGAAVAAGGILKVSAAYRDYRNYANLAKIAGAAERAGEAAKPAIAKAEGAALEDVMGKYGGLRGMLMKTGTASLGLRAATTSTTGVMAAGIGTVGLYAVALGGLAFDIGLVVNSFGELNKASRDFEASTAALNKAKAEGYDFKPGGGRATGYDALPVWKQYGYTLGNTVSFGGLSKLTGGAYDDENAGRTALTDAASNALAKKHGRPINGVTATMLREQAAQRAAAAAARREADKAAAGEEANKYELPPEFQYRMEHDKRQFDYLNRIDPDSKREESARKTEIEDLMKARDLLLEKAKLATDPKAKYKLMGQADEYDFEAQNMDVTKEKKDKRDKLDKHIATILGAGGLSEQEFLKRSGINGRYLSQLGKAPSHENTVSKAIKSLASRSMIINLQISPKIFEQVRADIKDEIFRDLEKVMSGSSPRAIFGGNN